MQIIYTFAIYLYGFLLRLAALFNTKARKWVEGRAVLQQTLGQIAADKNNCTDWQLAWFHCASLGEFEQGRPVIEAYKQQFPSHKILLTFFSPSGYEVRKNYETADYVTYLPLDTPPNVHRFLEVVAPQKAFFVKYEFWSNVILAAAKRQIQLIAFAVIFREKQHYFSWYGAFFSKTLHAFSHIFVQNEESEKLLSTIGYTNVTIAGDTRFDRVKQVADARKAIPALERFKAKHTVLVMGSAWPDDMACVFTDNLIFRQFPLLKIVIAPHELPEGQLEQWQQKWGFSAIRLSAVTPETDFTTIQVLYIDCIGLLSSIYQYADVAFIGGAFGKGLHNILEAAIYGKPVFFGNKNYQKFQEATDLLALGGAKAVASTQDFIQKWMEIEPRRREIAEIVKTYTQNNCGATERVLSVLGGLETLMKLVK